MWKMIWKVRWKVVNVSFIWKSPGLTGFSTAIGMRGAIYVVFQNVGLFVSFPKSCIVNFFF